MFILQKVCAPQVFLPRVAANDRANRHLGNRQVVNVVGTLTRKLTGGPDYENMHFRGFICVLSLVVNGRIQRTIFKDDGKTFLILQYDRFAIPVGTTGQNGEHKTHTSSGQIV
jgi:hypothetical protein